jgi:hypothetical protein
MKTLLPLLLLTVLAPAQEAEERVLLVPWTKGAREAPLFFSASAQVKARVGLEAVTSEQNLAFRIHQGKVETLSLALTGPGEITGVTGTGLRDWSLRVAGDGARFLDIRPLEAELQVPGGIEVTVKTRVPVEKESAGLLLPAPGAAAGFALDVELTADPGVDMRMIRVEGLAAVDDPGKRRFVGSGEASLGLGIRPAGSGARGLELVDCTLTGVLGADGGSVSFRLTGTARSAGEGAAADLLSGGAALTDGVSGDGWHVALQKRNEEWIYEIIADRAGDFPLDIGFEVAVGRKGDWRSLAFNLPSGVVVPVTLEGLGEGIEFDPTLAVVPRPAGNRWRGFLPAGGAAALAWHSADAVADGTLFFSSTETTDIRVGSGLLRQLTVIDLRVLQGKLGALSLSLDGPGEVLSVSGESILGWTVKEDDGRRVLEARLGQPIVGAGRVVIEAQTALGGFPVRAEALRMAPLGALRHSGWLRVANDGAVRIEVADASGLIQLAPGQFPGGVDESLRQVFVYRFPSAEYAYAVNASQVLPEVGLTEVTVYELAETDRRISADLELDIREAPLREWEMEIPADHAVAAVSGAEVADYVVSSEVKDGRRVLKILFRQAVADRQLVSLRLEKNEAAKAGAWELPPLGFPGVKSRRGYIGAVATAGYRLAAGKTTGVAEVPVTFFPKQTTGLQQAFRLREGAWSVGLTVEALGQSIQADVFHLYSLKSGAVYGSVLMNFFVVGAPATEWKISVPEDIGNIDVTGQNVGRDWRREGNTVIVPLSRPVLGAGTLLLSFERPMSSRGGTISPGEVSPQGVQGERGFVQVVSPLQVNHKSTSEGNLLAIDPSEIPAEFRLLSSAPTLGAWQYTARDFKIGMEIEWFEPGETIDQVVDFQKLSSRVSRDGQWVTDARIFVKTRGQSALRLIFPKDAMLWEAKVDGEPVNARSDGGETLVPLPSRADPNQAVEVSLRFGARAAKPARPVLRAPRLDAPVVIGEWTITGDEGRQLIPRGGTADLIQPALAESGWEWVGAKRPGVILLLVAGLAALFSGVFASSPSGTRSTKTVKNLLMLAFGVLFIGLSLHLARTAAFTGRNASAVLEYAAPVVAPGGEVTVVIDNLPAWMASTAVGFWILLTAGVLVVVRGLFKGDRWWIGCGLVLLAASLLSLRGGAPWFFLALALAGAIWLLPRMLRALTDLRAPKAAAAAMFVLTILFPADARAQAPAQLRAAESMIHEWRIEGGRLFGTVDVALRGEPGERFLLLREPAVLAGFQGEALRVVKAPFENGQAYWLIADASGRLSGRAEFEMPLPDPAKGWELPGGPAAMRQVIVSWDKGGWEFFSDGAAASRIPVGLTPNQSGAILVLGPADRIKIQARPRQRDAATEETRFFADVSNLFLPGPGVVNGRHLVNIRPAQGRVSALVMKVPAGFTVSDVVDGPVGSWRFDPVKSELRVTVEPAQSEGFSWIVETQRGTDALPLDLELAPLRVVGSAGELGFLGLAFGEDAQPETIEVEGLSRVNPEDFASKLLPRDKEGQPLALLQHAFRYSTGEVVARLKVSAVSPELRAESWQLVSLGEDRLVLVSDLAVTITRSGVFRLELDVPDGLEIESATGEGLSHWTEARVDDKRVVTLHLSGKTMGRRVFSLTLTGRPTGAQENWQVPRIGLRGASRETGVLTIVPERGLQVRAVKRGNVSQIDPRELADAPKDTARAAVSPGALAYRLLQSDWSLALAISRLDPWVTATVFHDATLREGQLLTRLHVSYRIENAAVKSRRVRIPGLDATAADTVRATGAAVADLVQIDGETDLWEIRFQRGLAGETDVEIEFQRPSTGSGTESIEPVVFEDVRQLSYFVALRAGGRLEIEAGTLPRGWQRSDWAVLQSTLGRAAGSVAPSLAFRVADPEGPLPVILKRHALADLRKLRVSEGSLTTLLSPGGDALTAVHLKMRVLGKSTLRLKLPEDATLFHVFVNDEGANLVREDGDWLFHVFPAPESGQPSVVRFVYSSSLRGGKTLQGPVLDVPMENLTWRVLVPEGWRLAKHDGDFDLKQQQEIGTFRLEDYQSFVAGKRQSDARSAVQLLDQANAWLQAGDQEKAGLALGNAVRNTQLDAASGEDARVQLRALKTQQAVLGLNTRRQKLVLDNRLSAPQQAENPQLDRAAQINPVLRGAYNFDPKQFDRFMEGNTADENSALKEIANRIVAQQLAAEPAPAALDVTLPERGTVLEFGRSVQLDGRRPMGIDLHLKPIGGGFAWLAVPLCLLAGAMVGIRRTRK